MRLKEQVYSVLVVSASERFLGALSDLLPPARYQPVCRVPDVQAARRAAAEREFDLVLINASLPDDPGVRFAVDASASGESAVLLLVRADAFAEAQDAVTAFGVFALPKPTNRATLSLALLWLCSARERARRSRKQAQTLEEKMAEIRLVNRAKWLLIRELKMDEPEAHRYIEKQSMDRCLPKAAIAKEILQTYA